MVYLLISDIKLYLFNLFTVWINFHFKLVRFILITSLWRPCQVYLCFNKSDCILVFPRWRPWHYTVSYQRNKMTSTFKKSRNFISSSTFYHILAEVWAELEQLLWPLALQILRPRANRALWRMQSECGWRLETSKDWLL